LRDEHLVETALAAHHPVSGAQFKARKRRTIERGTMMDRAAIRQFIVDDREKGLFRVNRRVFTDPDILEIERREIFDRCWLYAAHEAELARPGDFLTRTVGGRPLLIVRDNAGSIRVLLNSCAHRGNIVCRERSGSAQGFTCFYHAWSYDLAGALVGLPDEAGYGPAFNRAEMGLTPVPRSETYRGMIFVSFDRNIVGLSDYLGPARQHLDGILDLSDEECEIVPGAQAFCMRANWKLLVENSIDPYHLRSVHQRYFRQYLPDMGMDNTRWAQRPVGVGFALDGGHALFETPQPPAPLSEDTAPELAAIRDRLVKKFGAERARKLSDFMRILFIFPNLIMISSWRSVRTFYPVAPDYNEIMEWGLMPKNESSALRQKRIENFISFLGPGGFGTPDDIAGLEGCQRGFAAMREAGWSDLSRHMLTPVPPDTGELQQRSFWRQWCALASGATGRINCSDRLELKPAAE
jgi:p-cumate 2,3-dioxygenase subunit alpha